VKLIPFDDYVKVAAVSGGKNTVQLPGKTELIDNVPSTNPCIPGQWLPMKKINGDRQQPILISPRRKRKKVGWTLGTQIISSLSWDMWRNSQYRGGHNATNQKPTISNTEISVQAWPYGTAYPTKATSLEMALVHDGYIYGIEIYAPEYDWEPKHRLFRTPVNSWSPTYATSPDTGDIYRGAIKNTPYDLVILDGYLFIWWQIESRKHITVFNLATMVMASDYYSSNPDNITYRRIFYDSTYLYVIHDVAYSDYQRGLAKFLRSDGSYISSCSFAWPTWDFQTNNGFLCYGSEIRAGIAPRVGNSVIFPTLRYDGASEILYEVPAFNLDGSLKWKYTPTSHTLAKQYLSYPVEWYCYSIEESGCYFDIHYNTANSLYSFTDRSNGDKQIRNTLIACNDTYAFVLSEVTTIKANATYRSYDDWQQTAWKATWDSGLNFELGRRDDPEGQGAPGQYHADLLALKDAQFTAFDTLAFDEEYLPFQWIDRKEVFLRVLNILTGELVAEYGFSASESDTGTPESLVISRWDLITAIRVASADAFVNRTKEDYDEYDGPEYRDLMGLADDEYPKNAVAVRLLDYWEADWDPNTPIEYYWCACLVGYGSGNSLPMTYDAIGAAQKGNQVAIQEANFYMSTPTGPGKWFYKCVAAKHPAEDVEFHTYKYVPTCFDWAKTLLMTVGSSTYIIVAPTPTIPAPPLVYEGRLGIIRMSLSGGVATWTLVKVDIGPGDEFIHFCCNRERIYCFVGSDRTNCTLYEINLSGTIVTTKTGVRICNAIDENLEPMIVDNKLMLVDTTKISYIGA